MSIGSSSLYRRETRPGLYCVEMRTTRWEDVLTWYRETLGLKVLVRIVEDGYALLEAGETRIALLSRPDAGEASPRWSLGFEVENIEVLLGRLKAARSPIKIPKSNAEGLREVVTADPDGNKIRLFCWPNGA